MRPTRHIFECLLGIQTYPSHLIPSKCRTGKNAPAVAYPDLTSSIAPVLDCPELPRTHSFVATALSQWFGCFHTAITRQKTPLKNFSKMGRRMSLEVHILDL